MTVRQRDAQQDVQRIQQLAQARFGYKQLHPGQLEAISSLLQGHDTLAIMPTGAGKSAIYQIAGLLLPNPVIIVSPLIALQNDQVQSIQQQEIAQAAVLNSTLSATRRHATLEAFKTGELKFLLLAPEQFNNEETLAYLREAQPSLVVVDEAHCISEWGHDFRPDYLKLGTVLETLGHPVTLALTATAAPPVRDEIVQRLSLREPCILGCFSL